MELDNLLLYVNHWTPPSVMRHYGFHVYESMEITSLQQPNV